MSNFKLFNLPDLVVETLFLYLDVDDLLTLRLLCKITKSWVENPKVLRRLQLNITSEEAFNEISNSQTTVRWSNFKLNWDSVFIKAKFSARFLQKFSDSIRIFDLSKCEVGFHANESITGLVLACPSLLSLKIFELSCDQISLRKNGLETLKSNWRNLQYLEIKQVLCTDYYGVEHFGQILTACESLIELDPPIIAISSPEYLSFNYKLYFENYVIKPIINYLKSRQSKMSTNLKKLHLKEYLVNSDTELLFELAETCYNSNTVLYPETFVPFSKSIFLQLPEGKSHILQVLGSLGGINDLVMSMEKLQALEILSVSFRSFFVSENVLDNLDIPLLPNLKDVEMEMTNDPPWDGRPYKLSSFMRKFCSTSRPTVTKLKLVEVSRANDTTMIRAVDVVRGFPNLRKLEVINWDAEKSEFVTLWRGLKGIEEIQLRFCHNLNDDGIIGPDINQPPMLQLKCLRTLCLSDVGEITNLSFTHVFRHLKLKKFYHYTSSGSMVTKAGYNALAKGEFRDSIQEMMIQCSSEFKQMDQFCNFLLQFPKLRKPRFDNYPFHQSTFIKRRGMGGDNLAMVDSSSTNNNRTCCIVS